ncbi:unnamed protein product [Zymoseptoria tritici ST99CH_1A5]|uniref:DUF788 domain protein n=3 Tax=Zymoseptoria tritici TaxID=1047171 RepID=A0A1X7RQ75_ZYMT9|nr:unnamed protein product [Zymoseptoria tritici ST99CH_3D7]SMR49180.1 unnamed protein product [Zymoseptoria tritici ST99CH_1E4]SMR50356.1 unnamed protein product [Zymoseptoria tritici ST99CH_3D1]SMY23047.1 unnamed protein product [Zymoseptoria tritici ST99CH_1A5]
MAQKAHKTLATKNTATLNRTHLISLGVHGLSLLIRLLLLRRKWTPYLLLSLPALVLEFVLERGSRPVVTENGEVKRVGDDLEAKGLTEWMWDIIYWSWGNVLLATLAGDWAWWAMLVVPAYSAWLAYGTYSGMRGMMGGGAQQQEAAGGAAGQSKRQAKMEKRGGQRMQYRA